MASYWKVKVSEWNNHISIVLSFFFLLFSIKKKISCVLHEGSFSNICAVGWGKFQNFMQQFLGQIEKKKHNKSVWNGGNKVKLVDNETSERWSFFSPCHEFPKITKRRKKRGEGVRNGAGLPQRNAVATLYADTWKQITDRHLRGS